MGGFNPRTPTIEGAEFQPTSGRRASLNSPLNGIAMRVRPGAVTISRLHPFFRLVEGNPGLALEVLTTLTPTITETVYLPGTDTGATTTGWQDQGGSTLNYSDVDAEYSDGTNYARNTAALPAAGSLDLQFRGNNAGALGTDRVLSVRVGAVVKLTGADGNAREVDVAGRLVLNGTGYLATAKRSAQRVSFERRSNLGTWWLNPETGIPWLVGEVDDIIDAADADTFGIRVRGKLAAQGFRAGGLFLTVAHCAENRIGSSYTAGQVRAGWVEQVLANTSAASADTFYWLHLYALTGSTEDYLQTAILDDPALLVDDTAAGTGDCRMVALTTLSGPGGAITEAVEQPGQMFPILVEAGGAIQASSQPYVELGDEILLHRTTVTPYNAQQITTPNPTATFGGIQFCVGWQDPRRRPDQPLKVEVRTGVGAATGGGTLKATATLTPEDSTATAAQRLVAFDAAFAAATLTQHHVLFYSQATPGRGWRINTLDARSDLVTAGGATTAAEVEGATQGGQTDSYESGGTPSDRHDLPVALFAAPAGPSGLTATVVAGEGLDTAPKVRLTWTATAIGADFAAYRIYRRPSRAQAQPWELIAELAPRSGDTPAVYESVNTRWEDHQPGWATRMTSASRPVGPYDDGWDYAVTLLNASTGLESAAAASAVAGVTVTAAQVVWVTSNTAPWMNLPLERASRLDVDPVSRTRVHEVAGRDDAVTRVRAERPVRRWRLAWRNLGWRSEDAARWHAAAAMSGRQVALLTSRGDRALGTLNPVSLSYDIGPVLPADAELIVTGSPPAPAGPNMPAGLVLNGSSQYATVPDHVDLDPGSSPFTVIVAAAWPAWAASKTTIGKGNPGTADGWALATTATTDELAFKVDGATAAVTLVDSDATWFDGAVHVAAATSSGYVQKLYRDGTLRASTEVTHGAVSNAVALTVGAGNGGASGFHALNPMHAWAMWQRELTADEVTAATHWLHGHPGWRMPAGPVAFYDLRDDRCWDGVATTVTDLSGRGHDATIVGSPKPVSVPWPLDELDRAVP